jgi:hypothetical protein
MKCTAGHASLPQGGGISENGMPDDHSVFQFLGARL